MVDVELKANTTRTENYRASGNVYAQWDFLKNFQFKVMYSMDYASNSPSIWKILTAAMKVVEDISGWRLFSVFSDG